MLSNTTKLSEPTFDIPVGLRICRLVGENGSTIAQVAHDAIMQLFACLVKSAEQLCVHQRCTVEAGNVAHSIKMKDGIVQPLHQHDINLSYFTDISSEGDGLQRKDPVFAIVTTALTWVEWYGLYLRYNTLGFSQRHIKTCRRNSKEALMGNITGRGEAEGYERVCTYLAKYRRARQQGSGREMIPWHGKIIRRRKENHVALQAEQFSLHRNQ